MDRSDVRPFPARDLAVPDEGQRAERPRRPRLEDDEIAEREVVDKTAFPRDMDADLDGLGERRSASWDGPAERKLPKAAPARTARIARIGRRMFIPVSILISSILP